MKKCTKCGLLKKFSEFWKDSSKSDGLRCSCKNCIKKYNKEHEETIKRINNKSYKKHRDANIRYANKYRAEHLERLAEYQREYERYKKRNDKVYKLKCSIRSNLSGSFSRLRYKKTSKSTEILGCSFEFFKDYIEAKFVKGMSWDNYGRNSWSFDHIIPLAIAKTEEDVIRLCHYTNYQPLWEGDNIRKSDKVEKDIQFKLL